MPRLVCALAMLVAACSPAAGEQAPTTTPADSTTTVATAAPTTTMTPTIAPGPWAVVVIGDFGTGAASEATVAAAVREWVEAHPETEALITTGDNFYVGDATAAWEVPYGWVREAGLPVWATPGNHDLQTPGQWEASVEAFGSFPRWRTREAGGVTFVLMDSNQVQDPSQTAWLEGVTSGLDSRPWIAVFHHPAVSCGRHSGPEEIRTSVWEPLLDGVRLVLNGHDHNYQRFATKDGWRVITGGGGQSLHRIAGCIAELPDLVVAVSAFHFVTIEGLGDAATVTAHGVDGAVLDRFLVDIGIRP